MLLAAAIVLTQLLIPIIILLYGHIVKDQIEKQKAKEESNFNHHLLGFLYSYGLLGVLAGITNLIALGKNFSASSVNDVQWYYYLGTFFFLYVTLNILLYVCNFLNLARYKFWRFIKKLHITFISLILTLSTNVLAFNIVYALLGLIAAPIRTGALLLTYSTIFFFVMMLIALILKALNSRREYKNKSSDIPTGQTQTPDHTSASSISNHETDVHPEDNTTDASSVHTTSLPDFITDSSETDNIASTNLMSCIIAFFVVADVFLYLAFYYFMAMAVQPYTSSSGFLSLIGNLVPGIFILVVGWLVNCIFKFLINDGGVAKDDPKQTGTKNSMKKQEESQEAGSPLLTSTSKSRNYGTV